MPDRIAHLANLSRAPFVDRNAERGGLSLRPARGKELDLGRARTTAVDDHPARQALEVVRIGNAEHFDLIDPLDLVARMGQGGGEVAVVGENQEPFGVEIEPADRIDVLPDTLQQIEDGAAMLRVRSRRNVVARFVQEEIAVVLGALDAAFVDPDVVDIGIGLGAKLGHGQTVDRTRPWEIRSSAARRDAMPAAAMIF